MEFSAQFNLLFDHSRGDLNENQKKTAKMHENNVAAVYVGVSLSVNIPTLFFFAHKLCLSFFSETFLLVSMARKS